MLRRKNVVKKMSSVLIAAIVCSTSVMSGYAAQNTMDKVEENAVGYARDTSGITGIQEYSVSKKWECENGMVVELVDNVLTISGNGVPGDDVRDAINEAEILNYKDEIKCIINNGITEIPRFLFWDYNNLISIEIPNSVTSIGNNAFSDCNSLSSIEISNGLISRRK